MRLSRFRVYEGWAEARPWRLIQPARGFDVAIGHRRGPSGRFWRGDGFLGLTALASLFGIAWRRW